VANGKVYCSDFSSTAKFADEGNFERTPGKGTESVFCLDEKTGNRLWEQKYPVTYAISYPAGPRCTPVVSGGKVYFLGAEGNLLCCNAEKGAILWQKDLKAEYKTKSALWGYAGHPLIDGNRLITLAGGEGSHVVALDKDTGKEIWRSQTSPEQGYCPPTIIDAGGTRQLVVPGPANVVALDPVTGKLLWTTPYNADNGSIILSPVKVGEYLFVAGYNNKNLLLKLVADKPAVEVVWKDKRNAGLSPVNVQPIADGGLIYGIDQNGTLYAVEVPSGKRLWETVDPIVPDKRLDTGTAFIVKNGERFVFFNEKGELVFAKLSPTGYEEVSRAKVIEPTGTGFGRSVVWSMPAFANKRVYVRNDKDLVCVDLAK
jgi:outer membrane protein assembly factor BamB